MWVGSCRSHRNQNRGGPPQRTGPPLSSRKALPFPETEINGRGNEDQWIRPTVFRMNTRMKPTMDWYRPIAMDRLGSPVFLKVRYT